MKDTKPDNKKRAAGKKANGLLVLAAAVVVLAAGLFAVKAPAGGGQVQNGGDLKIAKSEVTGTARFYPYKLDGNKMEVLAVRGSDNTVRVAFNTCQVCYGSGRGYYKLDGDVLVCQNCGNRFGPDQVEKEKGGCNPVPIFSGNRSEDDRNIVISEDFMRQAAVIFSNWKN